MRGSLVGRRCSVPIAKLSTRVPQGSLARLSAAHDGESRKLKMDRAGNEDSAVPTLRATGLVKRFDGVEVLHGVDMEIGAGEVHALVGENGAGKSTIINILCGRLAPDAGRIELRGVPVELR